MPEKFRGGIEHEETKPLGEFESLLKKGVVKQGDSIIWNGMLYKIKEISEKNIAMEGFDERGSKQKVTIQGLDAHSKPTDPTDVYTHEMSDLDEAFRDKKLELVTDRIANLKEEIKKNTELGNKEKVKNLEVGLNYFEMVIKSDAETSEDVIEK